MSAPKGGSAPAIRYRPIYGGVFGKSGRYVLATMSCIERGLHAVRYMVLEPRTGGVLAASTDKQVALADARRLLRAAESLATREASNESSMMEQILLWPEDARPSAAAAGSRPKPVPRRRREIFERGNGRCHYCSTPLTLEGKWHVEHMLPQALGGSNEAWNLVAACVPCNLAKGDSTALEFVAQMKKVVAKR